MNSPGKKVRFPASAKWLASLSKHQKDFIRRYGAAARASHLQHIFGWRPQQIDLARRFFNSTPGRRRGLRPLAFSALFEAYHGRPPKINEYPPPHYRQKRGDYGWDERQEDLLRSMYGLMRPADIAAELTKFLVRITGDKRACRSPASINVHASQIKLNGKLLHGKRGIVAHDAALLSGISYSIIHDAMQTRKLPTFGRGKYRYIAWRDWIPWRDDYFKRQCELLKAVAALPEKCIGASEAKRRLGIGESHLGRFLQAKVLRAWKIGGVWHISESHVEEVRRARKKGAFKADTPEFRRFKKRWNASHREFRRRQRREAGHTKKAPPGFVTPVALAFEAGVAPSNVYDMIKRGNLQAAAAKDKRLYIPDAEAKRLLKEMREHPNLHRRREIRLQERIHQMGGLTALETMQTLGIKGSQLLRLKQSGKLHPFKVTNRTAYPKAEVLALKALRESIPPLIGRARSIEDHRPPGHLTISEAARKCLISPEVMYRYINAARIKVKKVCVGRSYWYYIPESDVGKLKAWLKRFPDRGARRKEAFRKLLKSRGLWSTGQTARCMGLDRATIIAYTARGILTPRLRHRSGFGYEPKTINKFARQRDNKSRAFAAFLKARRLWNTGQAAKHLRLKPQTLNNYARHGRICPAVRERGGFGWRPADVRRYDARRRQ